jgi:hypothetical protein
MSPFMSRMCESFARLRLSLRGRYVRLLEEEAARMRDDISGLRAENRALVNSLLGTAGVAPIETHAAQATVLPVRRRSWPQISAAREADSRRQLFK